MSDLLRLVRDSGLLRMALGRLKMAKASGEEICGVKGCYSVVSGGTVG